MRARQPSGTPQGGQFAPTAHSEADLVLTCGDADEASSPSTAALIPRDGALAGYYAATDAKHFDPSTPGSTFTDPELRRLDDIVALAYSQRGSLDGDDREQFIALGVPAETMRPSARYLLVRTPGTVGVLHSTGLPAQTPVRITRTKPGTPCVPVVQTTAAPSADIGTVILGPSEDDPAREIVYTAHPGLPIPAATDDRLDTFEDQTVPLSRVLEISGGETWLTTETAAPSTTGSVSEQDPRPHS